MLKSERIKCPNCEETFGQESRFLDHLTKIHDITDHLSFYLKFNFGGVHKTCECSVSCQEKLPWAGWKKGFTSRYVRGHNARVDSVYHDSKRQAEFAKKRILGFKEEKYQAWNKGLTKETSSRVAESSKKISASLRSGYMSGSIVDWHMSDPEKAKEAARKSSETKKKLFNEGKLTVWNKGKNKQNCLDICAIADNISKTMLENVDSSFRRFKIDELQQLITPRLVQGNLQLVTDLITYRNREQRLLFTCNVCGNEQEKSLSMLVSTPKCFFCHPRESVGQLELFEFVKNICDDAICSDRTMIAPKELDVYVPSKKFAIEYDGLYWHSEKFLDVGYATEKFRACCDVNIDVMRIFEDEWRDKRHIVESMIRHRLGKTEARVGARSCELVELAPKIRREFIDASHIDGDVNSTIAWGLIHKGEILAALSLRFPFHKSNGDFIEVARFCTMPNVAVPGALSRLTNIAFDWSKKNGKRGLMTYVDRRIGSGKGYFNAGYTFVRDTSPRFWWTDFLHRFDRFSIRANSKIGVTQQQAAFDKGVVKIWGNGNIVLQRVT